MSKYQPGDIIHAERIGHGLILKIYRDPELSSSSPFDETYDIWWLDKNKISSPSTFNIDNEKGCSFVWKDRVTLFSRLE